MSQLLVHSTFASSGATPNFGLVEAMSRKVQLAEYNEDSHVKLQDETLWACDLDIVFGSPCEFPLVNAMTWVPESEANSKHL